jgi:hypothetical protein
VDVATVLDALRAAGFGDGDLAVGAAVGFAESGFNANATAHEPDGSTSYGLWQINSSHGYPELTNGTWSSVTVNAQLAKRVFDAQGWNAWSTHKPSDPIGFARYTAYLPIAVTGVTAHFGPGAGAKAAAGAGVSTAGGAVGGAQDAASGILGGVQSLLAEPLALVHFLTTPDAWIRIGKVVIGTAIIIAGAMILARKPIESVGGGAAKVASVAAIV